MTTLITITERASSPGSFEIHVQSGKRNIHYVSGSRDAGDAAAKALVCAGGERKFLIVGPAKVMVHIPPEFRRSR